MNGKEMGYAFDQYGYWGDQPCPQWVMREQFYNCENFAATLLKRGFSLDRLFGRRRISD
ncbi:MAG: hypothetical protein Q4C66_02410 [Lachnospiraceae bacterium]|nr:hypothetical protein [Lachnospiraceae bacterium]